MSDYTLSVKIAAQASAFSSTMDQVTKKMETVKERTKAISDRVGKVGNAMTKYITKPAIAAGSALAGLTLAKGFARLTSIDEAKAKLSALGHDAQGVNTIMDSALQSVKGTAFGMAEAATTAATACAAGIQPGQELTKYLSTTASTAALAGTSMGEMGAIFNKVQTSQRAYTEELNQLADRGIPIYQWLADACGTSIEEVRKMASEGKISAEMFQSAIEQHVGDAAKTIGEGSFNGAIKNIWASIGRIGANFLDAGGKGEGFFSKVKPLLGNLQDYLATLEDKAADLGVKFGESFQRIVDKVVDLKGKWDGLSDGAKGFLKTGVKIGAIGTVGMGPVLKTTPTVVDLFGKLSLKGKIIAGVIGAVIAVFTAMYATNEKFRDAVNKLLGVFQQFSPILEMVGTILSTVFAAALDIVTPIIELIAQVLAQIVPLIMELVTPITELVQMLVGSIVPVITEIIGKVSEIISAIMPSLISIIESVIGVIKAIFPIVKTVIDIVIGVIKGVMDVVLPIIDFIAGIISDIMGIIQPIIEFIAGVIKAIIDNIQPIIETVSSIFGKVFDAIKTAFSKSVDAVKTAFGVIKSVVSPIVGFFSGVFKAVWGVIKGVTSTIGDAFSALFSGIKSAWSGLKGFVGGVAKGISRAFDGLVKIVKGLINGVIGGINGAIWVINLIPGVNISPISYLRHGTDDWGGGFAYMNEGGRGELVHLPNGSVVIPHDISRVYAKEAARGERASTGADVTQQTVNISVTLDDLKVYDQRSIEDIAKELAVHISREVSFG